jgi:hypothetical protein
MAGVVVVHLSRNEQGFGLRFQECTDGQGHMIVKVFENTEAARCGVLAFVCRPYCPRSTQYIQYIYMSKLLLLHAAGSCFISIPFFSSISKRFA